MNYRGMIFTQLVLEDGTEHDIIYPLRAHHRPVRYRIEMNPVDMAVFADFTPAERYWMNGELLYTEDPLPLEAVSARQIPEYLVRYGHRCFGHPLDRSFQPAEHVWGLYQEDETPIPHPCPFCGSGGRDQEDRRWRIVSAESRREADRAYIA